MGLNFLSPLFLFGLIGAALPILVHLLTRRQKKKIVFSAVYLLKKSQKRSVKRSKPNRIFLMLLRCLALALFCMALAQPIFSFDEASVSGGTTVFVLDDSFSMRTQAKDEESLYRSAVEILQNQIDKLPSDSEYAIVLASSPPRILQAMTNDKSARKKFLQASSPSYLSTDIGLALQNAFDLLKDDSKQSKGIVLLTDLDMNGWTGDEFSELAPNVPIQIIDLSEQARDRNHSALIDVAVSQEFLTGSRIIRVKSSALNYSVSRELNDLKLEVFSDGQKQTEGVFKIAPRAEGQRELTFPIFKSGWVTGRVEIGSDALEADNRRYFAYKPDQSLQVLVVDGDPRTVQHESESFYVERALDPFSSGASQISPTISTLAELPQKNLLDYSVIILCNVRELPFGFEAELEQFVMQGGTLFASLGDQTDPKYFNESLGNLFPLQLDRLLKVKIGAEPFKLNIDSDSHKVMAIFKGQALREMQSIRFNSIYTISPRPEREFSTPLTFTDGKPALIETPLGRGKTFLFVSTLDRDWNDFPIQPTFLPWLQRWVKYSALGLDAMTQQNLLAGEMLSDWKIDLSDKTVWVKKPTGKVVQLSAGEKGAPQFTETDEPGIYQMYLTSSEQAVASKGRLPVDAELAGVFTVNLDPVESDPRKISPKEIFRLLKGRVVDIVSADQLASPQTPQSGTPLTVPFLMAMAGIFLVEGFILRSE